MSSPARQFAEIGSPRLRAMQEGDLDQVAAIEIAGYPYPWSRGIFRDCLRAGYGCWVLERDDQLLGYGVLSVAVDEAHVLNVCVDPAHQGHGHGRHLMRRLVDLARWQHARRIYLEVRPSNTPAIMLYRTLGFVEIGRRPKYYPANDGREDALVMAREVSPDVG